MGEKRGYIIAFYLGTICTYIISFTATCFGFSLIVIGFPFIKINAQPIHIILISTVFTLYRLINDIPWLKQKYQKAKQRNIEPEEL